MPIEGIIENLKEAVVRHMNDAELAATVKDAIEALEDIDRQLDEAYKAGKYIQLDNDYEALLEVIGGRS